MDQSSPVIALQSRWPDRLAWAVLAALALGALLTFRDYGLGWDDFTHAQYGDLLLSLYASGFQDTRALSFVTDLGWSIGPVVVVVWARVMILARSHGVNLTDGLDVLATGAAVMVFCAYTIIGVWQYQESCAGTPQEIATIEIEAVTHAFDQLVAFEVDGHRPCSDRCCPA